MRIYSDVLTVDDVRRAVAPGARPHVLGEHRARSHARSLELVLSGHGSVNSGFSRMDVPSGTWDEYGVTLASLYALDPAMIVGSPGRPVYRDRDDFHERTVDRYRDGVPSHGFNHRHRWEAVDVDRDGRETYAECRGKNCDAARRWAW